MLTSLVAKQLGGAHRLAFETWGPRTSTAKTTPIDPSRLESMSVIADYDT